MKVLSDVKGYLKKQFDMKDLGEANYILGIKLLRDRKNKVLALSQASYIDKIVTRFGMENSKMGLLPFRHGIHLSKEQSPKTPEEKELMSKKTLCFGCWQSHVCYAMYQARYLLCSGSSKPVPIRSRSRTLDSSETYTQVFKENEGLYVGVFQWES